MSRRGARRATVVDLHEPVDGQLDLDLFGTEAKPAETEPHRDDNEPERKAV